MLKKRCDTSNFEVNRPLPTGENKKVIGLMKDELGGKIMTEFVAWMMVGVIKRLKEQRSLL